MAGPESAWEILGLARTADERELKRAYARLLKLTHPEDDPSGFAKLREAYESALRWQKWQKAAQVWASKPAAPEDRGADEETAADEENPAVEEITAESVPAPQDPPAESFRRAADWWAEVVATFAEQSDAAAAKVLTEAFRTLSTHSLQEPALLEHAAVQWLAAQNQPPLHLLKALTDLAEWSQRSVKEWQRAPAEEDRLWHGQQARTRVLARWQMRRDPDPNFERAKDLLRNKTSRVERAWWSSMHQPTQVALRELVQGLVVAQLQPADVGVDAEWMLRWLQTEAEPFRRPLHWFSAWLIAGPIVGKIHHELLSLLVWAMLTFGIGKFHAFLQQNWDRPWRQRVLSYLPRRADGWVIPLLSVLLVSFLGWPRFELIAPFVVTAEIVLLAGVFLQFDRATLPSLPAFYFVTLLQYFALSALQVRSPPDQLFQALASLALLRRVPALLGKRWPVTLILSATNRPFRLVLANLSLLLTMAMVLLLASYQPLSMLAALFLAFVAHLTVLWGIAQLPKLGTLRGDRQIPWHAPLLSIAGVAFLGLLLEWLGTVPVASGQDQARRGFFYLTIVALMTAVARSVSSTPNLRDDQ